MPNIIEVLQDYKEQQLSGFKNSKDKPLRVLSFNKENLYIKLGDDLSREDSIEFLKEYIDDLIGDGNEDEGVKSLVEFVIDSLENLKQNVDVEGTSKSFKNGLEGINHVIKLLSEANKLFENVTSILSSLIPEDRSVVRASDEEEDVANKQKLRDFLSKNPDAFLTFVQNAKGVESLILSQKITFDQLADLCIKDPNKLVSIAKNAECVKTLLSKGYITFDQLTNLCTKENNPDKLLENLATNVKGVQVLLSGNQITIDKLADLHKRNQAKFQSFVENAGGVKTLLSSNKISYEKTLIPYCNKDNSKVFFENAEGVKTLLSIGFVISSQIGYQNVDIDFNFKKLIEIHNQNEDKFLSFVQNADGIKFLLEEHIIANLDQLNKFYDDDKDKFLVFVANAKGIKNLLSAGDNFDQIKSFDDQDKFENFINLSRDIKRILSNNKITFDQLSSFYDEQKAVNPDMEDVLGFMKGNGKKIKNLLEMKSQDESVEVLGQLIKLYNNEDKTEFNKLINSGIRKPNPLIGKGIANNLQKERKKFGRGE